MTLYILLLLFISCLQMFIAFCTRFTPFYGFVYICISDYMFLHRLLHFYMAYKWLCIVLYNLQLLYTFLFSFNIFRNCLYIFGIPANAIVEFYYYFLRINSTHGYPDREHRGHRQAAEMGSHIVPAAVLQKGQMATSDSISQRACCPPSTATCRWIQKY